jgi:hypothetical protein
MSVKPKKKDNATTSPKERTRPKKKNVAGNIPECPAYEICRQKKVTCETCLEISEDGWREHVKSVLTPIPLV